MMIKPKKSVQNMLPYEVPLFEVDYDFRLDGNENSFGPSPKVFEALKDVENHSIQFYPIYGELLKKLSELNNLPIEYFINTNGADEAISVIYSTYLDSNDSVLTVVPTFAMPKIYAQTAGAEFIEIPYKEKWKFPEKDFLKALEDFENIKIVHLTTPNNPTGDVIEFDVLKRILEKTKDKLVVIDETYANYCGELNTNLVKEHENVFITRSFSKDFALAGLRIGYIISNPKNILELLKVRSPYSTNKLAMKAAVAALGDKDFFKNTCTQIELNKNKLAQLFEDEGFVVYPSKANFLCVDFGKKSEFIYNEFLKNSIKVRKFSNSPYLQNVFRITIPPKKGVERIVKVLSESKRTTLIFDMDGVLVDTRNSYREAIKKTYEFFTSNKISFDEIQSAKNKGGLNNDWDLTEFLLANAGIDVEKSKIINKFQEIYWDNGNGLIKSERPLIETETLDNLSKKYNLAVFTGRPMAEAEFTLAYMGFNKYFYPVVTMDNLSSDEQKPEPDGIELIKEQVNYDEIYYLGDTSDDKIKQHF